MHSTSRIGMSIQLRRKAKTAPANESPKRTGTLIDNAACWISNSKCLTSAVPRSPVFEAAVSTGAEAIRSRSLSESASLPVVMCCALFKVACSVLEARVKNINARNDIANNAANSPMSCSTLTPPLSFGKCPEKDLSRRVQ